MKQKVDQVRIYITDSEAVYRKGIRWALSEIESFDVIGEATTNIETLESIIKTPPELLIMNTNHDKPSGVDITRYIIHKLPNVKVILMMDEYHTEHVIRAMKSGAKACVSKSIDLDSLLIIISQVIHDELPIGHYLLKPKVAEYILKENEVSNQITDEIGKPRIKLVQSEEMILTKIRDDISLTDLATRFGVSEEIITDYLDEIAEKLLKIEHYNETLEQKYISNLISRKIGITAGEQNKELSSQKRVFHRGENEIRIPDEVLRQVDVWSGLEEETKQIYKQSPELNEPVKDISEVIELARKAGRLSSIQDFNQFIMSITEGLMTEIDRKRRILRRIKKAIEVETALVKDSDITWN
ncbi:MAG TPA: response regulator transcription factor [Dehalococcoidia bacterium]|nr:response regulator transcription factor [Dehalococcoidia bacterium]